MTFKRRSKNYLKRRAARRRKRAPTLLELSKMIKKNFDNIFKSELIKPLLGHLMNDEYKGEIGHLGDTINIYEVKNYE